MYEPQLTIDEIVSKSFAAERDGYRKEEVDTFLDIICDELEREQAEIESLQQQLNDARAAAVMAARPNVDRPQPASASADQQFREILETAERVKKETIQQAQEKADAILADAESQARARLGNLMDERDSLTRQVEALKATVSEYRTRCSAMLKAQQEALDRTADL